MTRERCCPWRFYDVVSGDCAQRKERGMSSYGMSIKGLHPLISLILSCSHLLFSFFPRTSLLLIRYRCWQFPCRSGKLAGKSLNWGVILCYMKVVMERKRFDERITYYLEAFACHLSLSHLSFPPYFYWVASGHQLSKLFSSL
ncbi:hypothetical protein RJT34_31291 [Clitoria ternatea]|uniref:Uncharacterized protein n=1 Tax=Clitoria ternatea TaxID=43366 RepID=A0AAN9EUD9_CLITE